MRPVGFALGMEKENRLLYWRTKRGLSLEQLANSANTSNQQISRLEKGQRKLDIKWMRRLARVLEIAPWQLLNEEDGATQTIPLVPLGEVACDKIGATHTGEEAFLKLDLEAGTLISVQVTDKSMEPIAPEGSLLVVDLNKKEHHPEAYYLVSIDGITLIRIIRGDGLQPEAEDERLRLANKREPLKDTEVIGRVVFVARYL